MTKPSLKTKFSNTKQNQTHSPENPLTLDITLGAGGAHGAYQWGFMTKFLDSPLIRDGYIKISGVNGTSTGAVNLAPLAYGLNQNDPDLAIELYNHIWADWLMNIGSKVKTMKGEDHLEQHSYLMQHIINAGFENANNFATGNVNPISQMANLMHISQSMLQHPVILSGLSLKAVVDSSSGVLTTHPQKLLREILESVIQDETILQNGPIDASVNTVTKIDDKDGLNKDNLKHHIHRGKNLTIESILASANLQKNKADIIINGEKHHDGAYIPTVNAYVDEFLSEEYSDNHLLVLDLNDPYYGIQPSKTDPDLIYGVTGGLLSNAPKGKKIYHEYQEHDESWPDDIRFNLRPDLLMSRKSTGEYKAKRLLRELNSKYFGLDLNALAAKRELEVA